MKATKYFALVAALLAVGCTNELGDDGIDKNTNVEDGIILTLTGEAQSEDDAEARIIVDGTKTSGKYNVKWRHGDTVGIFSADGTTLEGVDVGNGTKLANMLIGQHTTQFAAWGSNLQKGQTTAYAPGFAYVVCYQWGRYVPSLVWTHWWSIDDHITPEAPAEGGTRTNGNASVIRTSQPVSLRFAMEHPVGLLTPADLDGAVKDGKKYSTEFNNWSSDTYGDLWGNCGESNNKTDYVGTKSIYDPCPKGWRVADAATFAYMEANGSFVVCDNADTNYKAAPGMVYNNTLHLLNAGYSRGVFTSDFRLATEGGGATHDNKNGCTVANTWSNLVPGPSAAQPYMLIQDNKVPKHALATGGRSKSVPVRCQVDTENR